jgi:hypothetical protein
MKTILTNLFLFVTVISVAQTKLISHKSHSGSTENFRVSFENELFDIGNSNLGEAPDRFERNAKLDTVVYISKQKAIMITSEHCVSANRYDHKIIKKTIWKAGKDTVYNHVLFSKKHSLDSIKKVLKEEYNFKNDIENVVFIGFDNKKTGKKRKKENAIPVNDFKTNLPSKKILWWSVFVGSTIMAFVIWRFSNGRKIIS